MSERTLEYHVGADMQARLEPLIAPLLTVLPSYLIRLEVGYTSDDSENLVEIRVQPEYRTAVMRVSAAFFAECEDRQRETLTHEFVHVHVGPMADVFDALLDAVIPDKASPLRIWAESQWLAAEEGAVTDMAAAYDRARGLSSARVPVTGFARA